MKININYINSMVAQDVLACFVAECQKLDICDNFKKQSEQTVR